MNEHTKSALAFFLVLLLFAPMFYIIGSVEMANPSYPSCRWVDNWNACTEVGRHTMIGLTLLALLTFALAVTFFSLGMNQRRQILTGEA